MGPVPKWMKKKLKSPFSGEADFLEIDGLDAIEAVGADWSDGLLRTDGTLCPRAPVVFESNNANGMGTWGPAARGAVVVAIRGVGNFEELTVNAAAAGAMAIVIVDNEDGWKNDYVMTQTENDACPRIPAVLVSRQHTDLMCSGHQDFVAAISRRATKLTTKDIANNMVSAYWPF